MLEGAGRPQSWQDHAGDPSPFREWVSSHPSGFSSELISLQGPGPGSALSPRTRVPSQISNEHIDIGREHLLCLPSAYETIKAPKGTLCQSLLCMTCPTITQGQWPAQRMAKRTARPGGLSAGSNRSLFGLFSVVNCPHFEEGLHCIH